MCAYAYMYICVYVYTDIDHKSVDMCIVLIIST